MAGDEDSNRNVFGRADVVDFYAAQTDVLPEEQQLFGRHIPPGSEILDLGVGAGRTTPILSRGAARYVGLDYVPDMVAAAKAAHPDQEFVVGDASDLAGLDDESFDVVVFSFNGLDCLPSVAAREACLRECRRVLRDGGRLIVSSHNPRAILGRAVVAGTGPAVVLKRLVAFAWGSVRRAVVKVPQRAFWTGTGYMMERTHGGLRLYATLPAQMIASVEPLGFRSIETVAGGEVPESRFRTPWYAYAFTAV